MKSQSGGRRRSPKEMKSQSGGKRRSPKDMKSQSGGKRRSPNGKRAVEDLRIRLIEQLCRLPEGHLAEVQALLGGLDGRCVLKQPMACGPAAPHKDWPHAPVHRLTEDGTFIVTASTRHKEHFFRGSERLGLVESELLRLAKEHEIMLEAWAVFSNHYHFVAHTTGTANQLATLIARLHDITAKEVNRCDGQAGRQVWFNFWDTQLTFEKSYLARLNYVHQNAVKHGLVRRATEYPWCSAAWFERSATRAQVKTIYGFKIDRIKIDDDYEPVL
jgi:putative transposase